MAEQLRAIEAQATAALGGSAIASQLLFESQFSYPPKTDLRTPADVAGQSAREGWK